MRTPLFQAGVPVGVLTLTSDKINGFKEGNAQVLKLFAAALGEVFSCQGAFDALRLTER